MADTPGAPRATEEPRTWDLEAVYDEQIAPHMHEINRICKECDLPYVASFEYAPGEFCTSARVPDAAAPMIHEMWAAFERSRNPGVLAFTITTTRPNDHR